MKGIKYLSIILILLPLISNPVNAQGQDAKREMMVRIAEIEIYPKYLNAYKEILVEEAALSVKKEEGVIAIFPLFETKSRYKIRILEIYASKQAYEAHLQTPHFLHYKSATIKMVKSLKLVEMTALDKETMAEIFIKQR